VKKKMMPEGERKKKGQQEYALLGKEGKICFASTA